MSPYEIIFTVPEDRIGVLIGKKGETKRILEKSLGAKIKVDTHNNTVVFILDEEDPLKEMKIRDIIDAISHGFSPDMALNLLDDRYSLYKIDLRDMYGKNKKAITRYKGRVIGEKGSFKRKIEEYTDTNISIYDNYIYIIGKLEDVLVAKEGIEMILQGAKHSSVISFLERKALEKNLMLR